ncbi:MAG: type II toxin-antitoxin system VapC family toxin [Bifidobacteriaceae bacterium]|jgi:PIN domain nuclease of toxin-antitoxin system|nr:type II toxin-antitoxin system VapC family toxin [Bifidobacteriaceae bacterium]
MKYLLDTHTLLWFLAGSDKVGKEAISIIEDDALGKAVSVASLWEFSIKLSLGKLRFDGGIRALSLLLTANRFAVAPISLASLDQLTQIPWIHSDPFDRLLVATALAEDYTLLTADQCIQQYPVRWQW